jgi:Tfp pilus assembly protein PilV
MKKRLLQLVMRWAPRSGISLVEVIVALVLLAAGLLAVTSAGSAVISQLKVAQSEVELWAALQSVGDSLQQLGHGNVTDGSRALDGYNFTWAVDSTLPNLDLVTIAGSVTEPVLRADTMLIYLADF